MSMVMFLGMSSWDEGWAGRSEGNCSLSLGGWPGGRAVLPAVVLSFKADGHQPLYPVQGEWGRGALSWALRRLDHSLVMWTSCCLKQRDGLSVWPFFLGVQIPQPNFFPFLFLFYVFPKVTWILWLLYYLTPKGTAGLPSPVSGSVLQSQCPWAPFSITSYLLTDFIQHLQSAFGGIFPSAQTHPPSLLPASERDVEALVLCCC